MSLSFNINKPWTASELDSEKISINRDMKYHERFSLGILVAYLIGMALILINPYNWIGGGLIDKGWGSLVLTIITYAILTAVNQDSDEIEDDLHRMSSLSDEKFTKLLEWANTYPEISIYIDQVLADNREMTLNEFNHIEDFVKGYAAHAACNVQHHIN